MNVKFIFVDTKSVLITKRSLRLSIGEYNADPIGFALVGRLCKAGYKLVISHACEDSNSMLLNALASFGIYATLPAHPEHERGKWIDDFLLAEGSRATPIILDSGSCDVDEFKGCWYQCDDDGVTFAQMDMLLDRVKSETTPNKPIPRAVRVEIKKHIAKTGLNFTYVRKYVDGKGHGFGGLVVAWKIDTEYYPVPTVKFAVVRCHVRDQFDRTLGRELAAQRFEELDFTLMPVPEDGNVSNHFKKEFKL